MNVSENTGVAVVPMRPSYMRPLEGTNSLAALAAVLPSAHMMLPAIATRGRMFRAMDPAGEQEIVIDARTLDCVIAAVAPSLHKRYYAAVYDPSKEAAAPDCWSMNGISPDPEVDEPTSSHCKSCAYNAFGSAANGKSKACTDYFRIVIVTDVDDVRFPRVGYMDLPPTSLKPFAEFVQSIRSKDASAGLWMFKVRISFNPNVDYVQPRFEVAPPGWLPQPLYEAIMKLRETAPVMEVRNQGLATASSPSPPAPAPAPAPAHPPWSATDFTTAAPEAHQQAAPDPPVRAVRRPRTAKPAEASAPVQELTNAQTVMVKSADDILAALITRYGG